MCRLLHHRSELAGLVARGSDETYPVVIALEVQIDSDEICGGIMLEPATTALRSLPKGSP
jgi:hypothetical protein